MVVLQHVVAPEGVAAGRGYSQVVTGQGRLVVVSGQIAQDERGDLVGPGDPAAQARQVFENLRRCLAEAHADVEGLHLAPGGEDAAVSGLPRWSARGNPEARTVWCTCDGWFA